MSKITLQSIIDHSLRFARLLALAKSQKDDGKSDFYCRNRVWVGSRTFTSFEKKLRIIVGVLATIDRPENAFLKTQEAYQIAADAVYNALPNCRGCACVKK